MNPDSAEKMRNHLAEEVLDSNMLHLMKEYQKSLRKGQELDGAVDLLEQSSRLISIFRDRIPITSIHDKRIGTLLSIREWFRTWRAEGGSSSESKMKPSVKCLDDIDSLISTFTEIVKEHLKKFPGALKYTHLVLTQISLKTTSVRSGDSIMEILLIPHMHPISAP